MTIYTMIRLFVFTLTLACCLPCMAQSGHFLRSIGSCAMNDAGNQTTVTATKGDDNKVSVNIRWRPADGATKPMTAAGWFVFVEDVSRVWVFDGDALSLFHRTDKGLTDSSSSEVYKTCPKEVRVALPESFRKKYFP
jgi:hypothetical protein